MLDRLVGADRAAEGEALLGVCDRHLQRRLDRAERLGGEQRLARCQARCERRPAPTSSRVAAGAVERTWPSDARRVVARHRLDAHAVGAGLDGHRDAAPVAVDADDDEHVGARARRAPTPTVAVDA